MSLEDPSKDHHTEQPSLVLDTVEMKISANEAINSLHALAGISAMQTLKIKGYIKHYPLVVLIDNGSTHNFINRSRVEVFHFFIHPINKFHIHIYNGGMMKCGGCCENVKLQMGDSHLKTHMFAIEMGGCDIALGVEWLRILGSITLYFKQLYMRFVNDFHTHTLQGIKAIPLDIIISHCMEKILKKGHSKVIAQFHVIQGLETTPSKPHPTMQHVLTNYSHDFYLPKGLLPSRGEQQKMLSHLYVKTQLKLLDKTVQILRHSKPPKQNISKVEFVALRRLRSNSEIMIMMVDKVNKMVIMDTKDYLAKMYEHLSTGGSYKNMEKNHSANFTRDINRDLKISTLHENIKKKISPKNVVIPRIYGLPEIHKEGDPLRLIVNTIGSPTYQLEKFLAKTLNPFVGKTFSYIKDSTHFIESIKDVNLGKDDMLVSFDVISLYIKVIVDEAFKVIKEITNDEMANLVKICLKLTYFTFQGEIYEKIDGVAMGSPLSTVIVNIYMEHFER